jgi:hypothetical protein
MALNFEAYLKSIQSDLRRGNATEHTYRSALETLIESAGHGIDASNDPKHIECGAPDFIVERRKVPLGYIETKDVGTDLNKIEKTDQMKRYLKALHNLILTDYIEFRWYVNGERRPPIHLATRAGKDRLVLNPLGAQKLTELFEGFLATETPTVNTPKELAERLASVTHFIAEQIESALASGDVSIKQPLEEQYTVFKDTLLPALKPGEFSDLYAQTVTYGLFAAKISAPEGDPFSLEDAYKYLRRIPFLRTLFLNVNEQLDEIEIIRPYLQDIVSLLNRTNIHEILADFGKRTRTEDPVVHFYETFLAKYDPKMRESRGVYYTPEPVVQFIVRSVDEILKTRFNKPWGLADDSVKVLDPAAGTGTFLYYVIQRVHDEIVNVRGQGGQWAQKSKQLLNRLFGFELLIPPYTISHLKLGLLMDELGAPLEGRDERVHVYLTNTLEEGVQHEGMLPGLGHGIAKESSEAAKVKQADDIMVVLGNPPYAYESTNTGEWISTLIRDYYQVDGKPLGEANPKGLQDDYVKFIRYGEWRINKTGQGVLAFITNHGYLDNPTFRGMRKHLIQTFDEIFVLDLHGNSKKKETAPDGSKDENVFDIQQGVAIFIGMKYPTNLSIGNENVIYFNEIWGSRDSKYKYLEKTKLRDTSWKTIFSTSPYFLIKSRDEGKLAEFESSIKITEFFSTYSVGLYTARDNLAIQYTHSKTIEVINDFSKNPVEDVRIKYQLGKDSRDWKIKFAQQDLITSGLLEENIQQISYRPFDTRYTYYTGKSKGFQCMPRNEVMKHLVSKDNIALITLRRPRTTDTWNYCFVGQNLIDKTCLSSLDNASVFPLYQYSSLMEYENALFSMTENQCIPNINSKAIKCFTEKLGFKDLHELDISIDIFHYIYSILHCPTYRSRYAEFLKIDFPRIPLTSDKVLFAALVKKGKELVDLHLLKSPLVENFITTYPVSGDNLVEKVRYEDGRVYINPAQYFGGVPEAVWNFKIGGYQVCDKWLKDRKGRVLSSEDISHYQRVVVALHETIRLMKEIDKTIPKWPIE